MKTERNFVLTNSWGGEAIPFWEQIEHVWSTANTVGMNCFVKMSAQTLKLLTLRGWINFVMSTEACEMLGHESKDVRGLSQVSVNTSVMWLSGVGGVAAIPSEWHCSLIHVGLMVPQISHTFAIFGSLLPEVKFRCKSHQPGSCFWNMSTSFWYECFCFLSTIDLSSYFSQRKHAP